MGRIETEIESYSSEYRRLVIDPYFKIIYKVENNTIFLVGIWDTRRNPTMLIKRIIK